MKVYAKRFPKEYRELQMRLAGKFADDDWQARLPSKADLPTAAQPTRKSSGIAVQALVPTYNSFVAGSADLLESTFVSFKDQVEFQKVSRYARYRGRCADCELMCSPNLVLVTIAVDKSASESENSRWLGCPLALLLIKRACISRKSSIFG